MCSRKSPCACVAVSRRSRPALVATLQPVWVLSSGSLNSAPQSKENNVTKLLLLPATEIFWSTHAPHPTNRTSPFSRLTARGSPAILTLGTVVARCCAAVPAGSTNGRCRGSAVRYCCRRGSVVVTVSKNIQRVASRGVLSVGGKR